MENFHSTRNNVTHNRSLQRYLQNIYDTQCKFSASEDIETGIEVIINQILSDYFKQFKIVSCAKGVKVFQDYELIKVGSYYEKTKNHFPNEFDFMVVFGEVSAKPTTQEFPNLPLLNRTVNEKKTAYEYEPFRSTRSSTVTIDRSTVYLRKRALKEKVPKSAILKVLDVTNGGPAQTIQFHYISSSDVSCIINVDLVFALRSNNVRDHLERKNVYPDIFYENVLENGRVHYIAKPIVSPVKVLLTLTETEVQFMKNVLSKEHVQVYRLLKYLINGKDYNADQHGLSRHSLGFNITSYQIKCATIHHHYSCSESSRDVSSCVLDILYVFNNMLNPDEQQDFQATFTKFILQNEEQSASLFSKTMLYGSSDQRRDIWEAFSVFIKRLENIDDSSPEHQLFKPFREALKLQKHVQARHKRLAMDVNKTLLLRNSAEFESQKLL